MFGYTVPSYGRLSPTDARTYRRYYCEGCHQLRAGYGLTGTATVNYDMTFNTILLNGLTADCPDFGPTERLICVLDSPKADSRCMRDMAAYTLILTKWELRDDETDKPSARTKAVSLVLDRAIRKAAGEHPGYDEAVGSAFGRLRDMELAGCRDALAMGRRFGEGLAEPLREIAGDAWTPRLTDVFVQLTACVYLMDAVDDLDQDFIDGTYNPLLPESGYVNARRFIDSNVFAVTGPLNEAVGALQGAYSGIRPAMRGNVSLCDNVVYFGVPESARKVVSGNAACHASVKNVMSNRRDRLSERARGVVGRTDVVGIPVRAVERARTLRPAPAAPAAARPVPRAPPVGPGRPRLRDADPCVPRMGAEPARAAPAVALVHEPAMRCGSISLPPAGGCEPLYIGKRSGPAWLSEWHTWASPGPTPRRRPSSSPGRWAGTSTR